MMIHQLLVVEVDLHSDKKTKTVYTPKEFAYEIFGSCTQANLRHIRHFLKTDQIGYLKLGRRYFIPHRELLHLRENLQQQHKIEQQS
jgi:hypothetical protein